MDQEKDPLRRSNTSSEERKSSVLSSSSSSSHPLQDSSRTSLFATSHSQGYGEEDDHLLPNDNHQQQEHEQEQHNEGGKYNHLPLKSLLRQYQQQQQQQQRQQEFQCSHSNTTTDASSSTSTASTLPSPLLLRPSNEPEPASLAAANLSLEKDGTFLITTTTTTTITTTTITTSRKATLATAEESASKPFDLSALSTNPVQTTTDTATRTAGTTPNGIAGTAHRNLFESGQNLLLQPQYQIQHSQQQLPIAFRSSMKSSPLSFQNAFPTFERNKATTERALYHMQLVLDTIPLMEKMEYAVALHMAPHLVQLESDPTRFLRYTNWDAHAAAHKLVAYWKRRVAIFGQDRAYLPLTLWTISAESTCSNNHGGIASALSKDDVTLIEGGFIAYAAYPPFGAESTVQDRDSIKTVVVFDASRCNSDASDVRLRAFFYHVHCIADNPVSQSEGYVVLCIVQSPEYYDHHTMESLIMLLDTFPVRLKEWHTFDCSSSILCLARTRILVRIL